MEDTAGTLFGLPWYFIAVAVVSFVVVVVGMVIYTMVMNRIEADSEEGGPAATSFAAPAPVVSQGGWSPPPEPLHGFVVMCAAFMDNGATWLNMPISDAKEMLENGWGVDSPESLQGVLVGLSQSAPNAWNGVRLFRVALAGVRAGYIPSEQAFSGIRPVAQRLQATFPGFDAVWNDYLVGLRGFKGLAPDGSGDDGELGRYKQTMQRLQAAHFNGVEYRVNL